MCALYAALTIGLFARFIPSVFLDVFSHEDLKKTRLAHAHLVDWASELSMTWAILVGIIAKVKMFLAGVLYAMGRNFETGSGT